MIVPGLFVHVSGQLDAMSPVCSINEDVYGPVEGCFTPAQRLVMFCVLENLGLAICFLVYLKKKDLSFETSLKIQQSGRKLKHQLRKSLQTIGETCLVETSTKGEWRQATVAWVRNGLIKVNFSLANRVVSSNYEGGLANEQERWLHENETFVIKPLLSVPIYDIDMPLLVACASRPGRWKEARVKEIDTRDHCGNPLVFTPNQLRLTIQQARNLKSCLLRNVIDPYCVLTCSSMNNASKMTVESYTTQIKRHTRNPVWDESCVFPLASSSQQQMVKLAVFNHDSLSLGECLGELELPLSELKAGQLMHIWCPLYKKTHVLSMEGLGTAMQKMMKGMVNGQDEAPSEVLIQVQWTDTRFPTRICIEYKEDHKLVTKVLSRKACEQQVCIGLFPEEKHHGRMFSATEHVVTT